MSSIQMMKVFLPMMGLAQAGHKSICDHPQGNDLHTFNMACDGIGQNKELFPQDERFWGDGLKEEHILEPTFFEDHQCEAYIRVVMGLHDVNRTILQVTEKCKKENHKFTRAWKVFLPVSSPGTSLEYNLGKVTFWPISYFEIKQISKAFPINGKERAMIIEAAKEPVETAKKAVEKPYINTFDIWVEPKTIQKIIQNSKGEALGFFEDYKRNSIGIGSHKVVRASKTHNFCGSTNYIKEFEEIYKFDGKSVGSMKNLEHAVNIAVNTAKDKVKVGVRKSDVDLNDFSAIKYLVKRLPGFSLEGNSLQGLKMKHVHKKGLDFLERKKVGCVEKTNIWSSDARRRIGNWSSDKRRRLGEWSSDRIRRIGNWSSDTRSRIGEWSSRAGRRIGEWSSDTRRRIGDWSSDAGSRIRDMFPSKTRPPKDQHQNNPSYNGTYGWEESLREFEAQKQTRQEEKHPQSSGQSGQSEISTAEYDAYQQLAKKYPAWDGDGLPSATI